MMGLLLSLNLEQRIIWFVAQVSGCKLEKLQTGSRLLHDLGIDGDDAVELLSEYSEVFQVDMGGFEFGKYFGPEASFSLFRSRPQQELTPITIGDLVEYARRGHYAVLA